MIQSVFPKTFTNGFQIRAPNVEIDWRNPLTKGLYGCWVFGNGAPVNLVRRAFDPQNLSPQGNFGHGSYSASGAPALVEEFHGPAARWSAGNEGVDLSLPTAFQIERTEPLTIISHLTANVLRSGAALNYTLFSTNIDDGPAPGTFRGIRFFLAWDGISATRQSFSETSNLTGGNDLLCQDNTDILNIRNVLGLSYTGNSLASGVTFFFSGQLHAASAVTNTLSATIAANTPIPAIGRRTLSGAAAQVFKGDLALLFLWRGRALGSQMIEVDTNFDQMFLVPSYRRYFLSAVPGPPATPVVIRRAGVYA